jgi:hypothetical protein
MLLKPIREALLRDKGKSRSIMLTLKEIIYGSIQNFAAPHQVRTP